MSAEISPGITQPSSAKFRAGSIRLFSSQHTEKDLTSRLALNKKSFPQLQPWKGFFYAVQLSSSSHNTHDLSCGIYAQDPQTSLESCC
jgi:hypothetical protein